MTPERWRQVEEVFHAASEHDRETRANFLEIACRGDQDLRREVESLLAEGETGLLLNESLGTVSDRYVYDRVKDRDQPEPERPTRPWEKKSTSKKPA